VEGCSLTELAFEPDPPAHHFDQAFCDGEAQTSAGSLARFLVFGAEELAENFLLVFEADANPIVLDPNMDHFAGTGRVPVIGTLFGPDDNLSAFWGVFIGIADEIDEHLDHASTVSPNTRQAFRDAHLKRLFFVFNLTA